MHATILVTGGAGFIGSCLVRRLLSLQAARIVVTDISANMVNLEDVRDRIEFVRADAGCFESVLRMVETYRPQTIYHLGAMLGPACDAAPQAGIQANAMATYNLLEAARMFGVKQVIFASSFTVFAGAQGDRAVIDDYSTTRPPAVYAAAKLFSENLGLCYRRLHGIDWRSLRIPGIVGPGVRQPGAFEYVSKAISAAIEGQPYAIYVEPAVRVPLVYIEDIARAFTDLAAAPLEQINTGNYLVLGAHPTPSAQEIVDCLRAKIAGTQLSFQVNPAMQEIFDHFPQSFDDCYARKEWGWQPHFDLDGLIDDWIAKSKAHAQT